MNITFLGTINRTKYILRLHVSFLLGIIPKKYLENSNHPLSNWIVKINSMLFYILTKLKGN